MRGIFCILFLAFSVSGIAQNINFIKTYGNSGYDVGLDVKTDLDTGYVVTGGSSSFTSTEADAFILKVDSVGTFMWSHNYGGPGSDWGEKIHVTPEGGYAIGGYTNSFGEGGFDFYLIKTDPVGTLEWQRTFGGTDWDKAHGLAIAADSGYFLVGETQSFGAGNLDMYIIRTDKNGDTLWTKTYGGTEDDVANDVIVDGDSIVVVGSTESSGAGMRDGVILKFHIDGTLGWEKVLGQANDDYFNSIHKTPVSNEYFVGGSRDYHQSDASHLADFWIHNISADGLTLFADTSITGGSHEFEAIHDITTDNTDNCFFAGETKSFGYSVIDFKTDAWVGKLLNNYFWSNYANNFGEEGDDVAYGMDICWDYGVVTTGIMSFNSLGGGNLFIARIDRLNTQGAIDVVTDMVNCDITLSLDKLKDKPEYFVYPTVFENEIIISGFPENSSIQIYDMNGSVIYSGSDIDGQLDLSAARAGMYICIIQTESGNFSQKLIKY